MRVNRKIAGLAVLAFLVAGCGRGSSSQQGQVAQPLPPPPPAPPPSPPPPTGAPITQGDWTFYSGPQGLSGDIWDVSADEAGNVYVAGGDAVYVKQRTDQKFLRFDWQNAGLTVNCNDINEVNLPTPTKPD